MTRDAISCWRSWTLGWTSVVALAAAPLLAGCFVDSGPTPGTSSSGTAPPVTTGEGAGASSGPSLVDIDVNQALAATPGQGVGVYTEYQSGGHWHVWWTCDTALTGLPCSFQIAVTVASGAIVNLASEALENGDQVAQPGPTNVEASTTTTTGSNGMTFDTAAGAVITLDAQVNGLRQISGQSFLFFAQNGRPNGGYPGSVADPLMLAPASP